MKLFELDDQSSLNHRLADIAEFIRPFRELVIFHDKFRQACDDLLARIVALPPGSLIYLVGPTGVGKTALLYTLMNRFSLHVSSAIDGGTDTGSVPSSGGMRSPPIYIEAPSPQRHVFEWRDFDIRLLKKLHEPGIWLKTDLDEELQRLRDGRARLSNSRRVPSDWILFQCIEDALKARKPPFLCIDEAHNLLKMVTTAATFEDQMDVVKSMANLSKVTNLLSGTYKLKDLIYEGDETTRRSRVVHFGRYLNSGQDIESLQDYIAALTDSSPIKLDFDPLEHLKYFYTNIVGCGGILKDWFCSANCVAMLDERDRVRLADFQATALERKQLVKLIKEISAFERQFESSPDQEEHVLDEFWKGKAAADVPDKAEESPPIAVTRPGRRQRPGELKPTRFPLAEETTDA